MASYIGIVDRAEDGTWGVVFPDLPGCSSFGHDLEDLAANASEAVKLWAAAAEARGLPVPAPTRVAAEGRRTIVVALDG